MHSGIGQRQCGSMNCIIINVTESSCMLVNSIVIVESHHFKKSVQNFAAF